MPARTALSQSGARCQLLAASSDVCSQTGLSHEALLLAYTDVSGDFYYKNLKEGVQGFPVVPNKSAMR